MYYKRLAELCKLINFTINSANRDNLIAQIRSLDVTRLWQATIAEKKSKRSLEQNKWARAFARDWGSHIGYEADEAYNLLMFKCNPIFVTDKATGEVIRLAGSFGKLNTKEAANVQETMIRFAAETGFYWDGI